MPKSSRAIRTPSLRSAFSDRLGRRHLGDEHALRELEHQPVRRQPRPREHVGDDAHQLGRPQPLAGQVHMHGRVLRVAVLQSPPRRRPARLLEHGPVDRRDGPRLLRGGHEGGGREQAVARVVPPHQRLGGHDLAGPDGHDRLVVRDELVRVQRGQQLVARRRLGERVRVHLGREREHLSLARLLRPVHGDVGVAHEVVGVHPRAGVRGADADRGPHPVRPPGDRHRLAEQRDDAMRDLLAAPLVRVLQQHRELVAAQPRGEIRRPHAAADPLGRGDEHRVARGVPGVVVDPLEVVEIEEEHRRRARPAATATRARGA